MKLHNCGHRSVHRYGAWPWSRPRAGWGLCGALVLAIAACSQAGVQAPDGASGQAVTSARASSSPANAGASPTGQGQWDELVAAAKREGTLQLASAPSQAFRQVFDDFGSKFGISVNVIQGQGEADFIQRIATERKAGQFLEDVMVHSPTNMFHGLKPLGAAVPLGPALFLPEVLGDQSWIGGFERGWADPDHVAYNFVTYLDWVAWINRSVIPQDQLNTFDQLWDPRWKGKMAWQDPSAPSSGAGKASAIFMFKGPAKLAELLKAQAPALTRDPRQLVEWLIRGQYPIAIAVSQEQVQDFRRQGADISVIQPLQDQDRAAAQIAVDSSSVGMVDRAPHPNASKLFVNWLLSKEGQTDWTTHVGYNSRRTDVPSVMFPFLVADAQALDRYGAVGTNEASYQTLIEAMKVAADALK